MPGLVLPMTFGMEQYEVDALLARARATSEANAAFARPRPRRNFAVPTARSFAVASAVTGAAMLALWWLLAQVAGGGLLPGFL